MSYGEFINDGSVYRINTPFTPTQWSNLLFNDSYIAEVSQTLEGKSAAVENYVKKSFTGGYRNFYITSKDTVFSLSDIPEDYSCEHGLYFTALHMAQDGISSDISVFVPETAQCEVWSVTVGNNTHETRDISLFSVIPFEHGGPMGGCCRYTDGFMYKYSFPYHVYYEDKAKVENKKAYYYMYADKEPASYEGDGARFFGCADVRVKMPAAVKKGCCGNSDGEGDGFFVGAMHHNMTLSPGEKKTIRFIVGSAASLDEIRGFTAGFDFEEEYNAVKALWEARINGLYIETPDKNIDNMVNYWVKKQSVLLTRLNRMSNYCPVRNQLQDALGYSMLEPYEALEFGLRVLRRQREDGFLKQWYMTDGSQEKALCFLNHGDAPVWLIICIAEIIEQCGDPSVYDRCEGYIDGDKKESIYIHLLRAARCIAGMRGAHGLCLMLDGDWTDPINGAGRLGRGESTWLTEAAAYAADKLAAVAAARGDSCVESELLELSEELKAAVNKNCYIGGCYVAGFDDNGEPFGKVTDKEGRLFLNSQVWAIISGIAQGERLKSIVDAIASLETDFGPRLLYPAFSAWNDTWGRISIKQAGTTENGSVYCHASLFKAYSDCIRGDGNSAYETLVKTLPTNPMNPPSVSGQLPLFIPNYYFALEGSVNMGKSSCHYGTGSAAWFIWVVVKHMLGIGNRERGACVPDTWKNKCRVRLNGKGWLNV